MANENIFTTKVREYAVSRPSYAPKAIDRIVSTMLKEGDSIADIGSGTGIFSKEFLLRGYEVFCVEPNDAMRLEAEKAYGGNASFHSISSTAEQTNLPANSISLVTAASAFHWFDIHSFYKESKRILKHNGIVCIVANARIYDSFTEKQHQICKQYCPSYVSLTHGVDKVLRKADAFLKGISFWKDFIIHCIIQSRNSLPVVYRLHMPPKKILIITKDIFIHCKRFWMIRFLMTVSLSKMKL